MNPLLDAKVATLYNTKCEKLDDIKYTREKSDLTLIFSSKPAYHIPEHAFLMPCDSPKDDTSYFCYLTGELQEHFVSQTGKTWYLMKGETFDSPEFWSELRVKVAFPLSVTLDDSSQNLSVTVENISAGGLRIHSSVPFEPDSRFSFIFSYGHYPVLLTAHIVKRRPQRIPKGYSYSCQFQNLDSKSESVLRGFIFKENLIQRKKEEELSRL